MLCLCRCRTVREFACSLLALYWLSVAPALGESPVTRPQASASDADDRGALTPPGATEAGETLESAWQIALSSDQRLESSQWNLSAAASSLAATQAEQYPSVSLGANVYALSDQPAVKLSLPPLPFPMPSQLPFVDQRSVGGHALVTQPIYTFGRISHGIHAAQEGVQAHQAEVNRTELDVKLNVAELYVTVLRTARLGEVAESKVVSLTAHNQSVTGFFDNGAVSKNDLLAARVALADARQQAFQVRNGLQLAQAAYNRALGRPLTTPVQLAELHDDGRLGDLEQLTQLALSRRPELAGLAAQARALREQSASEQAKRLPQLGLMGGYIYQENQYLDPNGVAALAMIGEWNVLDSGRKRNQAAALCEKAEAVSRLYREAESQIGLEVRQRWLDLQTARERVAVARQATAQADENLRVARDRYQQQAGTNTEVLDAETLRLQAYTNLYGSSYETVLAGLRLRRAAGDL